MPIRGLNKDIDRKIMIILMNDGHYRVKQIGSREKYKGFKVQVKKWLVWVTIKKFQDEDLSFAFREADELWNNLHEK